MALPKIRTVTVEQIGDAPFTVAFQKRYLLVVIRVANRIDLSNYYSEANLTDYELGTANYTNFEYDLGKVCNPGKRDFSSPKVISDSFPAGTLIRYVLTFLEFPND